MSARSITRRNFLKRTATGVGGVVLAKYLGSGTSFAQPTADMSRVVVVKYSEATDGVKLIDATNVQAMMDEAIGQLTGQTSVADAWNSLLPDFREDHIVAIFVSKYLFHWHTICILYIQDHEIGNMARFKAKFDVGL